MTAEEWRDRIIDQMKSVGVYQEAFGSGINALAEILEQRDKTKTEFDEGGGQTLVLHKYDRGAENMKLNPLLKLWMDLNAQALTYWNSLGLTGKSYKQMNGSINVKVEGKSLEDVLTDLGI